MKRLAVNTDNATFITLEAACRLTNLGKNTVRRLATESNSARKIGKSFRINREMFLAYVDSFEL